MSRTRHHNDATSRRRYSLGLRRKWSSYDEDRYKSPRLAPRVVPGAFGATTKAMAPELEWDQTGVAQPRTDKDGRLLPAMTITLLTPVHINTKVPYHGRFDGWIEKMIERVRDAPCPYGKKRKRKYS